MFRPLIPLGSWLAAAALVAASPAGPEVARPARYEELVRLFREWRSFQKPRLQEGMPDYTEAAMAAQRRELPSYQRRLAAIDPRGWPIREQVDYHLVRAEMNGLAFDHRVLRPWARDPGFYATVFTEESDQPAREGPTCAGALELWAYTFPLAPESAARMGSALRVIPRLLRQARANLVGSGTDLWTFGTRRIRQQSADLAQLAARLPAASSDLGAEARRAKEETDSFAAWLDAEAPRMAGPSGVGIENYDWYLKNVQLVPYTWADEVAIMEAELARARALLVLEERRNAKLPPLVPIASAEEYDRRFRDAVGQYMAFLKDHEILTVRDYMEPALRARIGAFNPGPREFFSELDYRDPEVMRTHAYHWFDKARLVQEPPASPIRSETLLYNIFNTRTEGHATGWEELMMQAGMFDERPRARELVLIALAERAARALGELRMHSHEFTLEQAAAFASTHTPRGWLSLEGALVREEQHLYLQQPGYGTSYIIGKIQIERLLGERQRQLGEGFTLRRFMDEFAEVGLIPAALIRWELTGEMSDDVKRMLTPPSQEGAVSLRP